MSEEKQGFTPGPWTQDKYGTLKGSNGADVVEYRSGIASAGSPKDEYRANTRLRNAAPQLLEALKRITDQIERVGDSRKDAPWIEDARAAIRAAEGEA